MGPPEMPMCKIIPSFFIFSNSATGPAIISDANATTVPDGVRLVLVIPPDHPLAGRLTRDWARPTLGGSTP